ncbi:hypothetical protein Mapa_012740 [Marchantia paleacea]|nr:hypothetical protein Mapa_012740 [Marchantia paleacea]
MLDISHHASYSSTGALTSRISAKISIGHDETRLAFCVWPTPLDVRSCDTGPRSGSWVFRKPKNPCSGLGPYCKTAPKDMTRSSALQPTFGAPLEAQPKSTYFHRFALDDKHPAALHPVRRSLSIPCSKSERRMCHLVHKI